MSFVTASNCFVSKGHLPHSSFLVSGDFNYFLSVLWTEISCFSGLMMNLSSHKNTSYISEDVFIYGEMWIYLVSLLIPGRWSVDMCEDSIVLPSDSLSIVSFDIITGAIVVVACFAGCIFANRVCYC